MATSTTHRPTTNKTVKCETAVSFCSNSNKKETKRMELKFLLSHSTASTTITAPSLLIGDDQDWTILGNALVDKKDTFPD